MALKLGRFQMEYTHKILWSMPRIVTSPKTFNPLHIHNQPNGSYEHRRYASWFACPSKCGTSVIDTKQTVASSSGGISGCYLYLRQPIRFAGHSHWQNIRHTKQAADAKKQKEAMRIRQQIKLAIKSGGSPNPKLNRDLERVMELGKSLNLSITSMIDAIKKVTDGKDQATEITVEGRGVGKSFLMIECLSEKHIRTRNGIQSVLKRTGGAVLEGGGASHMFDRKGVLYVTPSDEHPLDIDMDKATEIAIESGAEEVSEGLNDDNQQSFIFHCDPKNLHVVQKGLESLNIQVSEARMEYLPSVLVQLTKGQLEMADDMLTKLESQEEVVKVYTNIEAEGKS